MDVAALESKGADMMAKVEQGNKQILLIQKHMKILAEIAVTDDPQVKKQKLAELAAIQFFETSEVD